MGFVTSFLFKFFYVDSKLISVHVCVEVWEVSVGWIFLLLQVRLLLCYDEFLNELVLCVVL